MNLENEIITLSNNLISFDSANMSSIISHIESIGKFLSSLSKDASVSMLDDILKKKKLFLSKEEFYTLKNGINMIKIYLFLYYSNGNTYDIINDCIKEYFKESLSCN